MYKTGIEKFNLFSMFIYTLYGYGMIVELICIQKIELLRNLPFGRCLTTCSCLLFLQEQYHFLYTVVSEYLSTKGFAYTPDKLPALIAAFGDDETSNIHREYEVKVKMSI